MRKESKEEDNEDGRAAFGRARYNTIRNAAPPQTRVYPNSCPSRAPHPLVGLAAGFALPLALALVAGSREWIGCFREGRGILPPPPPFPHSSIRLLHSLSQVPSPPPPHQFPHRQPTSSFSSIHAHRSSFGAAMSRSFCIFFAVPCRRLYQSNFASSSFMMVASNFTSRRAPRHGRGGRGGGRGRGGE